jgi:hypothetical protein
LFENSYQLWAILRETILRTTYLAWEDEIERLVSRSPFDQGSTRDFVEVLGALTADYAYTLG